jgi:hypothetical protein
VLCLSHPLFNVDRLPSSEGPSSEFCRLHISPVLLFLRELFLELRSRFCLRRHFSHLYRKGYGQLGLGYGQHSELGLSPIRSKGSARLFGNPSSLLLRVFLAVVLYLLAVVQYLSLFFVSFIEKNKQTIKQIAIQ